MANDPPHIRSGNCYSVLRVGVILRLHFLMSKQIDILFRTESFFEHSLEVLKKPFKINGLSEILRLKASPNEKSLKQSLKTSS